MLRDKTNIEPSMYKSILKTLQYSMLGDFYLYITIERVLRRCKQDIINQLSQLQMVRVSQFSGI